MEEIGIEQYLLMDYTAYKESIINNMIKNKRNNIDITILPHDKYQDQTDITILPHDKYQDQTVEEIAEDLKRMEKQEGR